MIFKISKLTIIGLFYLAGRENKRELYGKSRALKIYVVLNIRLEKLRAAFRQHGYGPR